MNYSFYFRIIVRLIMIAISQQIKNIVEGVPFLTLARELDVESVPQWRVHEPPRILW